MNHLGKLAVLGAVLAASAPFASADTISLASYGTVGISSGTGLQTYLPVNGVGLANTAMQYIGSETFLSDNPLPLPPPVTDPTTGLLTGPTFSTAGAGGAVDLDPNGVWAAPLGTTTLPVSGPNSSWVGINKNAGPTSTINPEYGYYEFQTSFNVTTGGSYAADFDVMADDTTEILLDNHVLISFGALDFDVHCSDTPPSCLAEDDDPTTVNLSAGTHTLTFIVEQAGVGPVNGSGDPSGVDFDATLTGPNVTPEPNSLILLGTGLLGAAGVLVRKRQAA